MKIIIITQVVIRVGDDNYNFLERDMRVVVNPNAADSKKYIWLRGKNCMIRPIESRGKHLLISVTIHNTAVSEVCFRVLNVYALILHLKSKKLKFQNKLKITEKNHT